MIARLTDINRLFWLMTVINGPRAAGTLTLVLIEQTGLTRRWEGRGSERMAREGENEVTLLKSI